jgi:hypothetical protein
MGGCTSKSPPGDPVEVTGDPVPPSVGVAGDLVPPAVEPGEPAPPAVEDVRRAVAILRMQTWQGIRSGRARYRDLSMIYPHLPKYSEYHEAAAIASVTHFKRLNPAIAPPQHEFLAMYRYVNDALKE